MTDSSAAVDLCNFPHFQMHMDQPVWSLLAPPPQPPPHCDSAAAATLLVVQRHVGTPTQPAVRHSLHQPLVINILPATAPAGQQAQPISPHSPCSGHCPWRLCSAKPQHMHAPLPCAPVICIIPLCDQLGHGLCCVPVKDGGLPVLLVVAHHILALPRLTRGQPAAAGRRKQQCTCTQLLQGRWLSTSFRTCTHVQACPVPLTGHN